MHPVRARALGLGLVAVLLPACTNGSASPLDSGFDASRAWKHLEAQVALGPRPSGSPAAEATRRYLEAELTAAGLAPVREAFVADTPAGPIEMVNVYADLAASASGAETVILCSHYETKRMAGFVGANDSASSTAVLLELARSLASRGPRPLAYRFLFVDGEESVEHEWRDPDNRYGSRHHVARLVEQGLDRRVRACVVIDLVGDRDLKLSRDAYSDPRLAEIFAGAAREAGLGAHVGGRRQEIQDDHLSFMAAGIPSVDLIDFEYAAWHTLEDTLDKCAPESLGVVGRIVLLGLPRIETHFVRR